MEGSDSMKRSGRGFGQGRSGLGRDYEGKRSYGRGGNVRGGKEELRHDKREEQNGRDPFHQPKTSARSKHKKEEQPPEPSKKEIEMEQQQLLQVREMKVLHF